MVDRMMSRRRLFGLAGLGAGIGLAALLPSPARAWVWFARKDLSREIAAFRWAKKLAKHPDAQLGSPALKRPPGRLMWYATEQNIRCSNALFETPARCASDVRAKYLLLEEYGYRSFWHTTARAASNRDLAFVYGPWFAQLDADIERFGVDINPWWRDGMPQNPMIDGVSVIWRDGSWHQVQTL